MDVDLSHNTFLVVDSIGPDGLVHQWNVSHPDKAVRTEDDLGVQAGRHTQDGRAEDQSMKGGYDGEE